MSDPASRTDDPAPPGSARREPLSSRFSPIDHVPARITLLNSIMLWGGSRIYRKRFGVGVNEWRVLGELSNKPGATAAMTARDIGMNKAIASRSIAALAEKGLIVQEAAGRARQLFLTEAGVEMFERIRPIAGERERVLLQDFDEEELRTLRRLLTRMIDRGDDLRAFDDGLLADLGEADDDEDEGE